MDEAKRSATGQLMRRALDLRAILNLHIRIGLDDIDGDEFYAMLIIEDEQSKLEEERAKES